MCNRSVVIGPIRCPMLKGVLHTNDYYPEILVFYGSFTFFLQLFYESFTVTWGGAGGRGRGKGKRKDPSRFSSRNYGDSK